MQFEVMRQHIGDRFYNEGDIREANEQDVMHLIKNGILRKKMVTDKADKEPPNVTNDDTTPADKEDEVVEEETPAKARNKAEKPLKNKGN